MRVLAIVHQPDAGPGVFAGAVRAAGAQLDQWLLPREAGPPRAIEVYRAVITLGGAMHADQESEHPWLAAEKALLAKLLERGVPVLGVCLGAQLLAAAGGAVVRPARAPEIGWYDVETTAEAADDPLFAALATRFAALEWHSYEFSLPPGAVPLGRSQTCLQGFRLGDAAWAIQFHAEVTPDDFDAWLGDYRSDPDAVALRLDVAALGRQARELIGGWNQLGRELCARFLAVAAAKRDVS